MTANNQLISDGTYHYSYDAEGNLKLKTSISTGAKTRYTWDHRNRLESVSQVTQSGGPSEEGRGTTWDWGSTFYMHWPEMINPNPIEYPREGSGGYEWECGQAMCGRYFTAVTAPAREGNAIEVLVFESTGNFSDLEFEIYGYTAEAGVDYATNFTVTPVNNWGEGSGILISIQTYADGLAEGTEYFTVHLSYANHPESLLIVEADILDSDGDASSWFVRAYEATEGEPLGVLLWADYGTVSLEYYVTDHSAVHGLDYEGQLGSAENWIPITFSGQQWVYFPTLVDDLAEPTESFEIHLRWGEEGAYEATIEADIWDDHWRTLSTIWYRYDSFDRLVRRMEDADGDGPNGITSQQYYSWENGQIALQFDGPTRYDLSHRYLYGPAVDQLLADEDVSSLTSPGEVLWSLPDHLGSVRDLVSYDSATDTTTLVNHRLYDAFGNLLSGSAGATVFGFAGGLFDIATGYAYEWHRWYDPKTGRWISEDPSGFFLAGDTNLYRNVWNSPTNFIDPSGLAGIGTKNHVYPLYLGGAPAGVGYDFPDGIDHEAFHDYLRENGLGRGRPDEARAAWSSLSEAERKKILSDAMRKGGASEKWIENNMDDVMKGAKPGVNQSPNRREPSVRPDPDRSCDSKSKTMSGTVPARGARRRSGAADLRVVGGIASIGGAIALQNLEQRLDQAALDAYYAGDCEKSPGLYHHGESLHENMQEQERRWQTMMGQNPEVEALPWWQRWLLKLAASAAQSYDQGDFLPRY